AEYKISAIRDRLAGMWAKHSQLTHTRDDGLRDLAGRGHRQIVRHLTTEIKDAETEILNLLNDTGDNP
ncbi:MAG: hypothetical protein ACRERU_01375, partial [Methylococcales bacterium]